MRHISKRKYGGFHLNRAHENPPSNEDEATTLWSNYNYKEELQKFLLEEQYFLCCYSEVRADQMGFGYHIEHVQPKSTYPMRTFDYQNLAASALHSNDLKRVRPTFGGHAKLGKYDPDLFISCHENNCARFFEYLSDGRVVAARGLETFDKNRAEYTIELLNLNSSVLLVERQGWWKELDELLVEHEQKDWSIEDLATIHLVPINENSTEKLYQFFSLTRQFFGNIAEQILQRNASLL